MYPFSNSFMPLYKFLIFLFLLFVSTSPTLSFRYSLFFPLSSAGLTFFFCNHCTLGFFLCSTNLEHFHQTIINTMKFCYNLNSLQLEFSCYLRYFLRHYYYFITSVISSGFSKIANLFESLSGTLV